jgi:hypothetical protein
MRRADMFDTAVNAAVGGDVLAPCFVTGGELGEAASECVMLGQSREFRIERRQGFKQFVVNLRLPGLLGALLRHPTARFQQAAKLQPRIQVGAGKLL